LRRVPSKTKAEACHRHVRQALLVLPQGLPVRHRVPQDPLAPRCAPQDLHVPQVLIRLEAADRFVPVAETDLVVVTDPTDAVSIRHV
jgi:hypothetical protein